MTKTTLDPSRGNRRNVNFIILGIVLISISIFWKASRGNILSFRGELSTHTTENSNPRPVKVMIKSLGLELGVEEGFIQNGNWKISEFSATHLTSSANPGEKGNIVIYGHNKKNLFGPIRWIMPYSVIELVNSSGETFKYSVRDTIEVTPDRIEYVSPKEEEVLTLYTCSGLFDQKRFVVLAKPVN